MRSADPARFLRAALLACRDAGEIIRRDFRSPDLEVDEKPDGSPVTATDRQAEAAIRRRLRAETPELGILGEELGSEGHPSDRWIVDPIDGTAGFLRGLPTCAVLIGLDLSGELVCGAVHAPLFCAADGPRHDRRADDGGWGRTWWAVRGGGAFAGAGTDPATASPRRLRVRAATGLDHARLAFGGLAQFREIGRWEALGRIADRVAGTHGIGDWWGHVLVAEGRLDAMIDPVVRFHDVAALKPIVEEAGGTLGPVGAAPLDAGFRGPVISSAPGLAGPLRTLLAEEGPEPARGT